MSTKDNWKQAKASVLDPLTEPTPDMDTGLNSSFVPVNLPLQANQSPYEPVSQQNTGASSPSSSNNPFRRTSETPKNPYTNIRESSPLGPRTPEKTGAASHVRNISSGTPEKSGGSSHVRNISSGSAQRHHFADTNPFHDPAGKRRSVDKGFRADLNEVGASGRPRRSSSLRERFPGDPSVRPLDTIKKEERKANHAPHLSKRHLPGADSIDRLDEIIGPKYHHEGPYDATLLARNTSFTSSPVAAVKNTNEEALKATPIEAVKDAVQGHRPLENTAVVAPGRTDQFGRRYNYEEGDNMNIAEGGNLGRWEGVDYKDDDTEGVGEPSYSIERNLRQNGSDRPNIDGDHIELMERSKQPSASSREASEATTTGAHASSSKPSPGRYADWERDHDGPRKSSISGITDGLKKRLSIRKKKET